MICENHHITGFEPQAHCRACVGTCLPAKKREGREKGMLDENPENPVILSKISRIKPNQLSICHKPLISSLIRAIPAYSSQIFL
jgi:hypothetical protein